MSVIEPEIEMVDRTTRSIRYLEHGWPSDLCRWHAHEEYELHLITETSGKAFVGDYIGEFKAGDLFLTGPNVPHNWISDELHSTPVGIRDMLVQFSHSSVTKLVEAFPEFTKVLDMLYASRMGVQFEGFNPTFARGHLEAIRDNKGMERILAFVRFLVRLNEHAEKKTLSSMQVTQVDSGSKHARIGTVIDHIIQNYREEFSQTEAAAAAGMAQSSFSRNFKSVTGHNFVDFITRVRVGQACSMLYGTDDQVTAICYKSGFQNLANFNRQFRKLKGMTPSDYRRLARDELSQVALAGDESHNDGYLRDVQERDIAHQKGL